VQAGNINRQRRISPGADLGVFIPESPVFLQCGVELRGDRRAHAVKLLLLLRLVGGIVLQAVVYQLVRKFYPAAVALNYSPEVKTRLVLKGLSVVRNGRLQFDAGWTDLAAAFMAIRQTVTASDWQATYAADRNEETGHADLAWACLHALDHEPLAGSDGCNSSFMEIYA
jgi:hypothetical protein